jgi:hypothetical protein
MKNEKEPDNRLQAVSDTKRQKVNSAVKIRRLVKPPPDRTTKEKNILGVPPVPL